MSTRPIQLPPIKVQDPDPFTPTGQFIEVPITGPAPATKLLYVGGELQLMGALSDQGRLVEIPIEQKGLLLREPLVYAASSYKLVGYTAGLTQSRVQHSTAVWLSSFGPFKDCQFQMAVDAIPYVGFDPAPNGGTQSDGTPFVADGTLYFVFNMAWKLSDNLFENCLKSITNTSTEPPSTTCLLYNVPLVIQVSSYITLQDPAAAPSPRPRPRPGG